MPNLDATTRCCGMPDAIAFQPLLAQYRKDAKRDVPVIQFDAFAQGAFLNETFREIEVFGSRIVLPDIQP